MAMTRNACKDQREAISAVGVIGERSILNFKEKHAKNQHECPEDKQNDDLERRFEL